MDNSQLDCKRHQMLLLKELEYLQGKLVLEQEVVAHAVPVTY